MEDFLVLGRDVVSRVLVCDERLLLTLVNGEVVDTLSDDPFSVLFKVTYLDENDAWRFQEPKPETGALEMKTQSDGDYRDRSTTPVCVRRGAIDR